MKASQKGGQTYALTELNELSSQLVSIDEYSDTRNLLQKIAESALDVLEADLIELYEYQQDQDNYILPQISAGTTLEPRVPKDEILQDDAVFQLIKRPKPLYEKKAQESKILTAPYIIQRDDQPNKRFVIRESISSTAAIPLRSGNESMGLMFANFRKSQIFNDKQKEIIGLFAKQAAIAIRNIRLFQIERSQAQTLAELNKLSQQLISIERYTDSRSLLERIAKSAKEVLKADLVELYEYRQDQDSYQLPQIIVGERLDWSVEKVIIYKDDAVWNLIRRKEPLFEENATKNKILTASYTERRKDVPEKRFVIREKIESVATIPLRTEEESMGLMFANYRTPQKFTKEKKDLIQLFAHQAAIAIQNTRLYYYVNKRRKALVEIGQKLTEKIHLNVNEILNLIYEQASQLIDTDNMSIALYDEKTDTVHFALAYLFGRRVDFKKDNGWQPRQGGKGKTEKVIKSKKHLLLSTKKDVEKEGFSPVPGIKNSEGRIACSWLGVPMLLGNRVIGVVANDNYEFEHYFSDDDIEILQVLANQAAIAIENSRLYDNLYNLNNRQKALVEIGRKLTSGIRLKENEIFELIYEEASKLLNMENFSIALYNQDENTISFVLASVKGQRVDVTKPGWGPRKDGSGKTEEIIHTKKYLLLPTRDELIKRGFSPIPGDKNYIGEMASSWLGVPMIVGEKVLGVIANYWYGQDYFFKDDDIKILQALADQTAIAIDNSRLFIQLEDINQQQKKLVIQLKEVNQRLEEVIQRQNLLVSFGNQLSSRIRYGEVELFKFIHEQANRFMDTDNMYIALYDETSDIVRFVLAYKNGEKIEIPPRRAGRGRTEELIRTGKPIFISTRKESEEWYRQPGREEYIGDPLASWIGVPMKVEHKVIGVVASYHPSKDNVYSKNDLEILQSMADLAAITMENARLYRELDDKILELEKAQEKIAESQTIITRTSIATDFVHRLNNLAGTIPIWVDQISNNLSTDTPYFENIKRYLENIESNTDELLRAAEQLKIPLKSEAVDIKYILETLVRQTRVQTLAKFDVKLECAETLPTVFAIASELGNALWVFIENGIDAMPDGGKLFLLAKPSSDKNNKEWIEIQIRDTGKGIAGEEIDKIFSPFYTTKEGHAGYGLWRAKNIIEKIGGNIKVESTKGSGTTFSIQLPPYMEGTKDD